MDTCRECGAEISPAEGYFNGNTCNACAFGLPEDVCQFNALTPFEQGEQEARAFDEAQETAEFAAAWEQMNEEREALASFNAVPSYFERYRDAKLAREYHEQGYSICRVD